MTTYGGYSELEVISAVLLGILATSSLVATLITLYLICDMNRWNGYMLLIFNLTLFQALYDVSFYFLLAFRSNACFQIFTFLATFSGLAVSIWTNIISLVLFYIVMRMRTFHIKFYIKYFFAAIVIVCGIVASLTVVFSSNHNDIKLYRLQHDYYFFRILSIIVNISIHIAIQAKLYHLGLSSLNSIKTGGGRYVNIKAINDPLKILSARLKYYPIVQIVTWVGAAWYEFEYGFDRNSFDADKHYTVWQQVCIYTDVICSPSAGLGFFIIFLVVQPTAYNHLRFKLSRLYRNICFCCWMGDSESLNYNRYASKMSADYQTYTKSGGGESSFESTFTSLNDPPAHTAESLTDPFMASAGDSLLLLPHQHAMDEDENSVGSSSNSTTYGNTSMNRGGGVVVGNRLPAGSFYEMDEEELAQQMESKYSISSRGERGAGAAGGVKGSSSSFSQYVDHHYSSSSAGGGALRQNVSHTGLAGLSTVNIAHISSIPSISSSSLSPHHHQVSSSPSGGGVAMPGVGLNNNNSNSSSSRLRGDSEGGTGGGGGGGGIHF